MFLVDQLVLRTSPTVFNLYLNATVTQPRHLLKEQTWSGQLYLSTVSYNPVHLTNTSMFLFTICSSTLFSIHTYLLIDQLQISNLINYSLPLPASKSSHISTSILHPPNRRTLSGHHSWGTRWVSASYHPVPITFTFPLTFFFFIDTSFYLHSANIRPATCFNSRHYTCEMVTLEHVEVHIIVSSSDDREFIEFDNPKAIPSSNEHSSDKFIGAITDLTYHIEVNLKPSFQLYAADGIWIGIKIDGGVVSQGREYSRRDIKEKWRTGSPFLDTDVEFRQGSIWRKSTFSFGSLTWVSLVKV